MKKIICIAFGVFAISASAQTEAEMEKAWAAYMTPGKVHSMLASEVGSWDEEMTMWMGPGAQPQKFKMNCEISMIMGGRYQQGRHTGDMMGMPFEGISVVGYNNASGKMESTWVDNMGTGIMYMNAPYDGSSKTIEFKGDVVDPMTKKNKKFREVYTIVDENTRKMEMYDVGPNGKEYKSMEIIMKRKK